MLLLPPVTNYDRSRKKETAPAQAGAVEASRECDLKNANNTNTVKAV
jgi:hypothetical protein